MENGVGTARSDFENDSGTASPAVGCAVKISIAGLDQRAVCLGPVSACERMQHSNCSARGHPKDDAIIVGASAFRHAVEIPIDALHQRGRHVAAVGERIEGRQRACAGKLVHRVLRLPNPHSVVVVP